MTMRVLVAMSGGVDSSVAAALVRDEGHDVTGVTMKLWGGESDSGCCSVSDVEDARRVAAQLGIPHYVFNFTDEFYQPKDFSREKSCVLLRLDLAKMPPNGELHRTDGDFPLAWAKSYGKGRVFYSSLGHAASMWDNPDVYRMYFEALKWSLGITEADATPRPLKKAP